MFIKCLQSKNVFLGVSLLLKKMGYVESMVSHEFCPEHSLIEKKQRSVSESFSFKYFFHSSL